MEKETRNHKVKTDYGIKDYYFYFKSKNKETNISPGVYGAILKEFGSFQRERFSNKGVEIHFPSRLGKAELRKNKSEIEISDDGTVVNNLPVNWQKTRELWKTNPLAKERKIKIRFTNEHTEGYSFKVLYMKKRASYENKRYYFVKFNRQLKRDLSKSIFKGRIDAFINE